MIVLAQRLKKSLPRRIILLTVSVARDLMGVGEVGSPPFMKLN